MTGSEKEYGNWQWESRLMLIEMDFPISSVCFDGICQSPTQYTNFSQSSVMDSRTGNLTRANQLDSCSFEYKNSANKKKKDHSDTAGRSK